jgi:hypothetical protein
MNSEEIDPMKLPILNNAIPGTLPPLKKKRDIWWEVIIIWTVFLLGVLIATIQQVSE